MGGIGVEKEEGSREFEFEHTEAFSSFAEAQSVAWSNENLVKPRQLIDWEGLERSQGAQRIWR